MKTITIAGRVGKNGELRRTQDGKPVLGFSVAVDDGYGDRKGTLWFDVAVWGKRGESLKDHIRKGDAITVSGTFGTREHDGKTYLTVDANDIALQGGNRQSSPERSSNADTGQSGYAAEGSRVEMDDEVPFAPEVR